MKNDPLPRLDANSEWRDRLLPYCRLKPGEIWHDPVGRHRVGCLDATDSEAVVELVGGTLPTLAIQDPPYNLVAFDQNDRILDWGIAVTVYDRAANQSNHLLGLGF